MADMEKNCYLGINGKKQGPMSEQDIKELFAQNKINGDTKFIRQGMDEWIPLSKSGITFSIVDDDGLPPLPQESKPSITAAFKNIVKTSAAIPQIMEFFVKLFTIARRRSDKNPKIRITVAVLGALIVLFILGFGITAVVARGNKPSANNAAQNTTSTQRTSAALPSDSIALVAAQNSGLPALDKIAINDAGDNSIKIPSSWDFYDMRYGVSISCENEEISMHTEVSNDSLLKDGNYEVEDFTFADGKTGFYAKNEELGLIIFAFTNEVEGSILETSFSVDYRGENEWFEQNEGLIYAVARTLTALPNLDKTATLFDVVSIKLPSTWDYSTEYVDESSIGMLHIDCKNEKIRIGVRSADDFYNFPGEYKVEDFTFADGTTGYYAKNNEDGVIVFAFTDENEIFETSFSVNYYSESDWFAQNEELIYAVARTLSYEETYDDYYIAGDNREQINGQGDSSAQGDTSGRSLPTLGISLDTFITNFHNAEARFGGSFLTIRDVSDFILVKKGQIYSTYESRTFYSRDNAISGKIRVFVRVRDDYVASVMFVNTGTPNRDALRNLSESNLLNLTVGSFMLLYSVIPDFPENLAFEAIRDMVYLYEDYLIRTSFSENGERVFLINRVL